MAWWRMGKDAVMAFFHCLFSVCYSFQTFINVKQMLMKTSSYTHSADIHLFQKSHWKYFVHYIFVLLAYKQWQKNVTWQKKAIISWNIETSNRNVSVLKYSFHFLFCASWYIQSQYMSLLCSYCVPVLHIFSPRLYTFNRVNGWCLAFSLSHAPTREYWGDGSSLKGLERCHLEPSRVHPGKTL